MAGKPGGAYNPLFLHGASGRGKSHLLQAVAHHLRQHRPTLKVRYITAEDFYRSFTSTDKQDERQQVRDAYRQSDVLIVDDVQFVSGKGGLQTELQHTYDRLKRQRAQIVFAANKPPGHLTNLRSGLRGRFQSGLVVNLKQPSLATRAEILRQLEQESSVRVPGAGLGVHR